MIDLTEDDILCMIQEYYLEELSTYQLAKKYKISPSTVQRILKKHGYPLRPSIRDKK